MSEALNRTLPDDQLQVQWGRNCIHGASLDAHCQICADEHAPKPIAIQAGDVVQLKSGGPRLTVLHVSENANVTKAVVAWFGDGDMLQQAPGVPISALKKL